MEPIQITLVTAAGCHYCEDARRALESLGDRYSFSIDLVPLDSEAGRSLIIEHRVPFPPLLMVNGSVFGHGRISGRKLERRLAELQTAAGRLM